MIAVGGTIASVETQEGLQPEISSEEILTYIPEVSGICQIDTIQLFNIDSTNLYAKHWKALVECIEENYEAYDGFVVTHGTDTMAYTAAALSYFIQNSRKPIVITGSQITIAAENTDARDNLLNAFIYAADDHACGAHVIFDNKVILGTRARKSRTKSYNAFSSIDYPSLAVIQDMNIMRYIPMLPYEEEVRFYEKLDENVFLMKLIPGIRPKVLKSIFENYDCIIVESFGVGGIPQSIAEEFYRLCQEHPDKLVVMATQVAHEGSDMTVYEVGHNMKEYCRFLESYDMTLESVIAKVMWMLGNYDISSCDIEEVFYHSINYDLIFGKNRKCN